MPTQAEYTILTNQLSEYVVKLLGQVRTGAELDVILRESTHKDDDDRLARLKLAIRYGEKLVSGEQLYQVVAGDERNHRIILYACTYASLMLVQECGRK